MKLAAVPVDSPAARIRVYHVECGPMLQKWELIVKASHRNREPGVIACNAKPLMDGRSLEISVADWRSAGGKKPRSPRLAIITTQGLIDAVVNGLADAGVGAPVELDIDIVRNGRPVAETPVAPQPARQFPLQQGRK